jgi:hypothetical protein
MRFIKSNEYGCLGNGLYVIINLIEYNNISIKIIGDNKSTTKIKML